MIDHTKLPCNCYVCGISVEDTTVACIPGLPISVAYCDPCIVANAHPVELIAMQVALCGGTGAVLDNVSVDYIPVVHDTLTHLGKSMDEFEKLVDACKVCIDDAYTETPMKENHVGNDTSTGTTGSTKAS